MLVRTFDYRRNSSLNEKNIIKKNKKNVSYTSTKKNRERLFGEKKLAIVFIIPTNGTPACLTSYDTILLTPSAMIVLKQHFFLTYELARLFFSMIATQARANAA